MLVGDKSHSRRTGGGGWTLYLGVGDNLDSLPGFASNQAEEAQRVCVCVREAGL